MKKQKNKAHILFRFTLVTLLLLFVAVLVVTKLFMTTVVNAEAWNKRARSEMNKIDTIAPERGNILASNGSILACNKTVYEARMDLRHFRIPEDIPWQSVDSLADSLDVNYPRVKGLLSMHRDSIKKYSWHKKLREQLEMPSGKRTRALLLAKNISIADCERIGKFPFVKDFYLRYNLKKKNSPYYYTSSNRRMLPYGDMAKYSIGRVHQNLKTKEWHGYSGLEKDLDSLLYGIPGLAKRVTMTKGIGRWITREPQRGYDVLTTIDIDIQDILEEELMSTLEFANAEWGTAIIMDVNSGDIKAISNLERLKDGTYGEAYNRIVDPYEPGSVVKILSMLIAFEDGLVSSVNQSVDCSPFQGTSDPHAPTVKSIKQVIGMSSNTGTARILFKKYSADPASYYERVARLGFFEPMHTGIAEEKTPHFPKLLPKDRKGNNITMTARLLSLARQTYGYNTEIPPLYTLSIYNAIAAGGRYVRPRLVRGLRMPSRPDSIFPVRYIRDRICSEETAAKLRECLHEVVWGKGCTGRRVQDDRVEIAGKTGTVYPVREGIGGYDTSRRRYAFAGFFPYSRPKYSCMVLILAPAHSGSAASLSGGVLKNVAVKLYARGLLDNESSYAHHKNYTPPVISAGADSKAGSIGRLAKIDSPRRLPGTETSKGDVVPDVTGMAAPAAIAALEKRGLNVLLSGTGTVTTQSIPPGTKIKKGSRILLIMKQ